MRMISKGGRVRSVHISRMAPRRGWSTTTKRTRMPTGRHNRSAARKQTSNYFAAGIVGIGHEVERLLQSQRVEQQDHLVQQGSLVAVGKHGTFVDATGQSQGQYAG